VDCVGIVLVLFADVGRLLGICLSVMMGGVVCGVAIAMVNVAM